MTQWDIFVNGLKEFFNQQVPIIGCTIGFVLIFALVIISKTSIGTKALKKLKSWYEELVRSYRLFKEVVEKMLNEQKEFYESELKKAEAKYYEIANLIVLIAENTHNEKVKSALIEYKEKVDLTKTNFEEYINTIVNEKVSEATSKFEDTKAKLEEEYKIALDGYKSKFEEILKEYEKLAQYKDLIGNLDIIGETEDEQREETINPDSTEEKVQEN